MLVRAAVEAVQQWIYAPTLLNGEPVEVQAPIEVKFILNR
jgi:protein TonB